MPKYKLTNKAVEDLSGIWNYTYDNLSEKQADMYYYMLLENFIEITRIPNEQMDLKNRMKD